MPSRPDPLLLATIRQATPNFRPLGQELLANGLLYRSGELASLDARAWDAIGRLGIRTAIDLRGPAECAAMPVRPPPSVRLVSIPFLPGDGTRFEGTASNADAAALIGQAYRHMVASHGAEIARVFRHLAEEASLPAVLFCTAGKDRTGLVSAFLLGALGFSRADILADYARTNMMLVGPARRHVWDLSARLATFGMPGGPIVDAMLAADPAYLHAALEAAGSLPDYLAALGIDAGLLSILRQRLLGEA